MHSYSNHQHMKRIIPPRKDEFYRTDLPSHSTNFYSSSSVYSYSPTSTSDCPEHGRSKKKITIILTVSIALATLGVLTIAGVAAYLGVLSKNVSTNSSSEEPSYLLSGAKDKNPVIITRGRIADDLDLFNEHNTIDVTNSLSESNHGVGSTSSNYPRPDDRPRVTTPKVLYSQRNSTSSVIKTSSGSQTPAKAHRERFPNQSPLEPSNSAEKTSAAPQVTTSSSNSVYDAPIIIRAPPTHSTTVNPYVRNRHRNRYPPTNSHSLSPPVPNEITVSFNGAVNVQETKSSTTTAPPLTQSDEAHQEPNDEVQGHDHGHYQPNGHGGPVNEDYTDVDIDRTLLTNPGPSLSKEYFVPVPPYTSRPPMRSWPANVTSVTPNKTLAFDRVRPEYYDKSPWTPLLNRPNLDKRPRVDVNRVTTEAAQVTSPTTTASTTTTTTTEDVPSEALDYNQEPAQYEDQHDRHGNHEVMQQDDAYYPGTGSEGSGATAPGETPGGVSYEDPYYGSQSEEEMLKPPDIPAYTVYIPHISSPVQVQNGTSPDDQTQLAQEQEGKHDNGPVSGQDRVSNGPHFPIESRFPDARPSPAHVDPPIRDDVNNVSDAHLGSDNQHQVDKQPAMTQDKVKEEDYPEEEDDEQKEKSNIYKLDPLSVDMVPDTLATAKPPVVALPISTVAPSAPPRELRKEIVEPDSMQKDMPSDEEPETKFEKVPLVIEDPEIRKPEPIDTASQTKGSDEAETSGEEMSSEIELPGSKPGLFPSPGQADTNSSLSSNNTDTDPLKGKNSTEAPLFPPVRSYVGINQPLRPKPEGGPDTDLDSKEKFLLLSNPQQGEPPKKVRIYKEEEEVLPNLSLSTTSSLNKVLSMMMNFDQDQSLPVNNVTTQNVQLVVADNGKAIIVKNSTAGNPSTGSKREPKVFHHRDPKIDTRFGSSAPTQHVPVPLISTTVKTTITSSVSNSTGKPLLAGNGTKLSSVSVTNSPVYKFVLRKGQSVEDLLKEIFQNFTEKSGQNVSATLPGTAFLGGDVSKISTYTDKEDHAEDSTTPTDHTTAFTRQPLVPGFMHKHKVNATLVSTPAPKTTADPVIRTSTSVVVNGDLEPCPTNTSFRCESNGRCISAFARCNGIRDCPDNSDERGCLCVDHLRAQMLHRKICDGVPDCKDFSDEYQCDWCTPGQYICAGSRACVNRDKICDGKRDCPRGDDENECVKIGQSGSREELEDLTPTYHRSGILMVRKKGVWGKLCVETFSTVVSHWEVKDLARAVCKALTFSDFEAVERIEDVPDKNSSEPYYELYYGASAADSSETTYSSSESTPRSGLGFKQTQCKSRLVVRVTCQDLQCGTAPRAFTQSARIVGGSNAHPGEWPWQAALYRNGEYQCGATLISSRWLLSAGHCFYHAQDDYWVARLGTLRRGATVLSPYEQVVRITHVFLHPQYKDVGFINDVSLLRLEKEVNFTDFVRPVCLPGKDTKIRDGRMCTVVGWGQLFEVGRVFPDTLQEVQLPLISTAECRKRTLFLPLYKLTDEMFCAGFDRGGRDACLGDSGGPLMCSEGDGRWSLYGVTSNGYGCARANRPGVYTKVAKYLDWIYEKMSQESELTYREKVKPCNGHRCPLGECLEPKRLCNGFSDCLDGSDERNCTWS